jgi:hypothetical protein
MLHAPDEYKSPNMGKSEPIAYSSILSTYGSTDTQTLLYIIYFGPCSRMDTMVTARTVITKAANESTGVRRLLVQPPAKLRTGYRSSRGGIRHNSGQVFATVPRPLLEVPVMMDWSILPLVFKEIFFNTNKPGVGEPAPGFHQ